jgi:putative Holliday junction resolvase
MTWMKLLGIDYGRRRIGLAIGSTETRIALPLRTLEGRNDPTRDARLVIDAAHADEIDAFVVGLPLNMDGSAGPQADVTRRFAAELGRMSGKPVHLHDERLSTAAADEALDAAGIRPGRRTGLKDSIAAQQILQAWFDSDKGDAPADSGQAAR